MMGTEQFEDTGYMDSDNGDIPPLQEDECSGRGDDTHDAEGRIDHNTSMKHTGIKRLYRPPKHTIQ